MSSKHQSSTEGKFTGEPAKNRLTSYSSKCADLDSKRLREPKSDPDQPLGRVYKLANGGIFDPRWLDPEFNLWRRQQSHRRWIRSFIEEDRDHTLLATITFRRYESLTHAKLTGRKLVRWWKPLVDGWVRILEQGGGGVHVHFVLRVLLRLKPRCEVELVAAIIRQHQTKEGIGNWQVESVRNAEFLSEYLTKQFRPGNKRCRVKGRAITYSASIDRPPWWRREARHVW